MLLRSVCFSARQLVPQVRLIPFSRERRLSRRRRVMRPFSAANLSSNFLLLCIKTAAVRMPEGTATVGVPCRVPLTSGNEARGPSNHDRCPLLHSDVLLSRQKRLGNTPQGLGDSRQLLWGDRLFAVGTLDEDAPLVVDLVGDENGSTAQVAVAERAPATIRRHIWYRGRGNHLERVTDLGIPLCATIQST